MSQTARVWKKQLNRSESENGAITARKRSIAFDDLVKVILNLEEYGTAPTHINGSQTERMDKRSSNSAGIIHTARKSRKIHLSGVTEERLRVVWDAFGHMIHRQLQAGNGYSVAHFGKIFLDEANNAPYMHIGEEYARRHMLVGGGNRLCKAQRLMFDFNYTLLDVECKQQSNNSDMTKDLAKIALWEILNTMGSIASKPENTLRVQLPHVGVFRGGRGQLRMSFSTNRMSQFSSSTPRDALVTARSNHGDVTSRSIVGSRKSHGNERSSGFEFGDGEMIMDGFNCATRDHSSNQATQSLDDKLGVEMKQSTSVNVPQLNLGGALKNGTEEFLPSIAVGIYPKQQQSDQPSETSKLLNDPHDTIQTVEDIGSRLGNLDDTNSEVCLDIQSAVEKRPAIHPGYLERVSSRRIENYKTNVNDRVRDRNLKLAFDLYEQKVQEEVEFIRAQEQDIVDRNTRADVAYKQKVLNAKRTQLELNSYLVKQAKERQDRDNAERELRAQPQTNSNCKVAVLPGEKSEVLAAENEKEKRKLRRALRKQIEWKQSLAQKQRANAVQQEVFILECVKQQLRDDRKFRLQQKYKTRKALQQEWTKQRRTAALQKVLQDAKNGRLSCVDDLLLVRSSGSMTK